MTTQEMIAALIEWVEAHLPEIGEARSAPDNEFGLPDVAVAVTRIQQIPGRVQSLVEQRRTCEVMLAAEPDPSDSAGAWLYNAADTLMDELRRDRTLGGRVTEAEIATEASFEPPFVEFEGGGRARQATLTIFVRDRVAL